MLIKVCGLTRMQDLLFCEQTGADLLGFIFFAQSPRMVPKTLLEQLPPTRARKVGVFVRHSAEEIIHILDRYQLDLAQLHGPYSVQDCLKIGPERVIKVLWPESYQQPSVPDRTSDLQMDLDRFAPYCKYLLMDAGRQGGGHGKPITSSLLAQADIPRPWFLAGGLGPDNVLDLCIRLHPQGIDLNSGVETSPGEKDHEQLKKIFEFHL